MTRKRTPSELPKTSIDYEVKLPSHCELFQLVEESSGKTVYVLRRYGTPIVKFVAHPAQVEIIRQNKGEVNIASDQVVQ